MKWEVRLDILVLLLLMLLGDLYETAAGYVLAVVVHEWGHLAAVKLAGGTVDALRFGLTGGVISYHGVRSYLRETAIALAGAGSNLLAAFLLSVAGDHTGHTVCYVFSGTQIVLAVFNLLPIPSLDGGNALTALLCLWTQPREAETLLRRIGYVISFILLGLGVYIFGKTRYNGTMLVCGASLFALCLREGRAGQNILKGTNPIYAYLAEKA